MNKTGYSIFSHTALPISHKLHSTTLQGCYKSIDISKMHDIFQAVYNQHLMYSLWICSLIQTGEEIKKLVDPQQGASYSYMVIL